MYNAARELRDLLTQEWDHDRAAAFYAQHGDNSFFKLVLPRDTAANRKTLREELVKIGQSWRERDSTPAPTAAPAERAQKPADPNDLFAVSLKERCRDAHPTIRAAYERAAPIYFEAKKLRRLCLWGRRSPEERAKLVFQFMPMFEEAGRLFDLIEQHLESGQPIGPPPDEINEEDRPDAEGRLHLIVQRLMVKRTRAKGKDDLYNQLDQRIERIRMRLANGES